MHAAGESSPGNIAKGTHAVVLAVPNVAKLLALEKRLIEDNIKHVAIREPDAPWNNEIMAIGVFPCFKKRVSKYLSCYPLLKELQNE